jgi:hypothetical protein
MPDDPLKSQAAPPSDAGLLATARSTGHPGSPVACEEKVEHRDETGANVKLPAALRNLPEESTMERVPQGTLSPERMRQVLRRLADGTYVSPQAQDVVARRIQKDLGLSTGSDAP